MFSYYLLVLLSSCSRRRVSDQHYEWPRSRIFPIKRWVDSALSTKWKEFGMCSLYKINTHKRTKWIHTQLNCSDECKLVWKWWALGHARFFISFYILQLYGSYMAANTITQLSLAEICFWTTLHDQTNFAPRLRLRYKDACVILHNFAFRHHWRRAVSMNICIDHKKRRHFPLINSEKENITVTKKVKKKTYTDTVIWNKCSPQSFSVNNSSDFMVWNSKGDVL